MDSIPQTRLPGSSPDEMFPVLTAEQQARVLTHGRLSKVTTGEVVIAPREKVTCWPPPEVPQNMDTTIGNLGLTSQEEDQLVAFLKTLTDGYKDTSVYPQKIP